MEKKNNNLLEKLALRMKRDKRFEILIYVGIAAIALMLYFSSSMTACTGTEASKTTPDTTEAALEARLTEMLSGMSGVGEVRVMVRCESVSDVETGLFGEKSKDASERIVGVLVIAEGAKNIAIRLEVTAAVCTVLGIDEDCVNVFEFNKNNGG